MVRFVQKATAGPFVAGNEAGLAFNTWPKMGDDWVPPEVSLCHEYVTLP